MRNPGREVQVKYNIAESTPKERQEQIDQQRAAADDEENEDTYIEDVTPTIHKNDIQTVHLIPGITLKDDQAPGQLPTYDSRWTIRKMFSDIPITHRSFGEAKTKALRYELQGDSGANCTATDREELLWQVQYFKAPLQVKTFDGEHNDDGEHRTIEAIGAGILKMVDNSNHIMDYYCLLIPHSTGTVISLDKFMRDNRDIVKFQQVGTVQGTGYMKFYDKNDQETHAVTMEERNGLWYASNSILMPPTAEGPTKRTDSSLPPLRIHKLDMKQVASTDSTDIDARHFYAKEDTTPEPDPEPPDISIRNLGVFGNMSKALKQLELWHQRTGHLAPRTLRATQKCVDGMPPLPDASPIFNCKFCDMAKQRKSNRGPAISSENFKPGTAYHMDFGFIRGPDNLPDMVANGTTKGKHVIEGRRGENCYLLIIDAATRQLWTFPLKNKNPPTTLIDTFLKKNGIGRKKAKITTSPDGMLARSNRFQQTCESNGFEVDTHETEVDFEYVRGDKALSIRTDNGGEFITDEIREIADQHGYVMETISPDKSSQNGLAERPHRTLKERVRCLLYTAGLGVEFWPDALIHATWLYNRTYHSAIDMTPHQAFTRRKPTLDNLLTFGCTVTPKMAKDRTSALDPNSHHGIFLGYIPNNDIRYWDIHTQSEKTAGHGEYDELQYGDNPTQRSPASKHLLNVMTGADHAERRTDVMHEKAVEVSTKPVSSPINTTQLVLDSVPPPYTATAAKFERPSETEILRQLQQLEMSLSIFDRSITERISLRGNHPTLGLIVEPHADLRHAIVVTQIQSGTSAAKIPRWRSRYRNSIIQQVNGEQVTTPQDLTDKIRAARITHQEHIDITFGRPQRSAMTSDGIPQLHFDQLNVIAHHLHAIKTGEDQWQQKENIKRTGDDDAYAWPPISAEAIDEAVIKGLAIPKLSRRKLKDTEKWPRWRQQEWGQLTKYDLQEMFGKPIPRPLDRDTVILPWVWTYLHKIDPNSLEEVEKARGTCNGGKRYGKAVTLAETYAACVEHPAQRLFWAITASEGLITLGCDVANAFAEAPPPTVPFYMEVDDQFRDWWVNCMKREPIQTGWVIPIQRALQGHPESPRLWHQHIHNILTKTEGFECCTHEPCLYFKRDTNEEDGNDEPEVYLKKTANDGFVLILRQVDDFAISGSSREECNKVRQIIQNQMANELHDLGVIKRFNGLDIHQARDYVKTSCELYIDKIVRHHGWENEKAADRPVPMRNDAAYQATLELATAPETEKEQRELEKAMGFSYRQAIGELIFALTICRPDIAVPVIKLSQYASRPALEHYKAVKAVFVYLNATRDDGLVYWRKAPRDDLPDTPHPRTITPEDILRTYPDDHDLSTLYGATDATWGADRSHRRSVGGIVFLYAGGAVYYKCRYLPTIALSSTEAEFASMADAGKAALYLRSLLSDMGFVQELPTEIQADNHGALQMATAQQPTRRTRHIDMKQFVILQWSEEDLISFTDCPSALLMADSMTKQTGRTKFYEHMDIIMGRRKPRFSPTTNQCVINVVSASHNLRQLRYDKIVSSMAG
jgi:hypothetical protein